MPLSGGSVAADTGAPVCPTQDEDPISCLKPLLRRSPARSRFFSKDHATVSSRVFSEMVAAGYRLLSNDDFLARQAFLLFEVVR